MTELLQPDLFGEWDAQERRAAELQKWRVQEKQPQMCPYCGTREPNGFALQINHNVDWETGRRVPGRDMCTAQFLRSNHLTWAVRQGIDLTRYIDAVREMKVDPAPIIQAAKAQLRSLCTVCLHNPKCPGTETCESCANEI